MRFAQQDHTGDTVAVGVARRFPVNVWATENCHAERRDNRPEQTGHVCFVVERFGVVDVDCQPGEMCPVVKHNGTVSQARNEMGGSVPQPGEPSVDDRGVEQRNVVEMPMVGPSNGPWGTLAVAAVDSGDCCFGDERAEWLGWEVKPGWADYGRAGAFHPESGRSVPPRPGVDQKAGGGGDAPGPVLNVFAEKTDCVRPGLFDGDGLHTRSYHPATGKC